jgi:hypothetical protein
MSNRLQGTTELPRSGVSGRQEEKLPLRLNKLEQHQFVAA